MAHQGVAVGVQPARGHRDHGVAGPDPARAEQLLRPRRRRWSSRRRRTRRARAARGARRSRRRPARSRPATQASAMPLTIAAIRSGTTRAGGDVVGEEQRLGAADDEVVDEHADEVEADRVVDVERLGDRHLGADAVGGGGQQRPVVGLERAGVEEPGEAADAADHLGTAGLLDPDLHQARRRGRRPRWRRRRPRSGALVSAHGRSRASGAPPPAVAVTRPSASSSGAISSRCLPRCSGSGSLTG